MGVGNWWSRRWELLLRQLAIAAPDGYASRSFRVKRLEVVPGGISAAVQDRDGSACAVEIRVATLLPEQWERVGELLGRQALVNAQVLSGAMPPELEQLFVEAGAHLLPEGSADFVYECSCCSPGSCRHVSLVFSLFSEMLNEDPGLLFTLRGRDRQQLLREVREARPSAQGGGESVAYGSGESAARGQGAAPVSGGFAENLDQYWGNRKLLKQFHHHIAPPSVELSLLRRLGPLNATDDAMAVYEQLVTLYRRVTEEALALAYAPDSEVGDGER